MATKTITITNEAYERLSAFKESKESFSDVIKKITGKYSLLDLVGVLTSEEANELEKYKKEMTKRLREQLDKVASDLR